MLDALFDDTPSRMEPDTEIPSHLTLEVSEDGEPELARFTYVDEDTCIGCRNCAMVARSTFFMEDSIRGRARVFNQGGDTDDLIEEAIDSCPVNCIHYVSHEDLITLEKERIGRDDSLDFNNYASFKKGWTGQDMAVPETKAKYYGSLAQGNRCNNCPSRGCAQCPMFGIGENPIYRQRLQKREARKVASGQAAKEAADREAQRRIDILFGSGTDVDLLGDGNTLEESDAIFDAIFGEGYSFESLETPETARGSTRAAGRGVVEPTAGGELAANAAAAKAKLRDVLENDAAEGLDPYVVLGVSADASLPEIKRAFRRLAMRWHPDRCTSLPELEKLQAELIFKQINLANEVLTDEAKRREYDKGANLADLVAGFWESLARKMRGGDARAEVGGVVTVAAGSGVALEELAAAEEEDSGIQAPILLGAFTEECVLPPEEDAPLPAPPAADGSERLPGVKYDYWGRPMA